MSTKSKIRFDSHFIQRLLDKLQTGDRRSIHLNAVPGRLISRLDLHELSSIDPDLPMSFMQKLLGEKTFKLPLSFRNMSLGEGVNLYRLEKRLNHIVNQDREHLLEFGQQNFGFGYPLLIKHDRKDTTKIIKAPLVIWNLSIERSERNKSSWLIAREEDAPIKANELLSSHIGKDEALEFPQLSEAALEDGLIDHDELISFCREVLSKLGSDFECPALSIGKCPDGKELEAAHNRNGDKQNAWISFNGIFGLYKAPKEAIIQATQQIADQAQDTADTTIDLEPDRTSTISSVDTNPSQEQIINTLENDEIKLIQGPPGTGKSQSITAIISNALANENKCLLICEKKVALEVVYNNLIKIGLDDFVVLIDDVNKDRKAIIEKARRIRDQQPSGLSNGSDWWEFENHFRVFAKNKQTYNQRHRETLKPILGNKSRKDLIGCLLKHSRANLADVPTERLQQLDMGFSHQEYMEILAQVRDAQTLYVKISPQSHKIFGAVSEDFLANSPHLTTAIHEKSRKTIADCLSITQNVCAFLNNQQSLPDFGFLRDNLGQHNAEQLIALKQRLAEFLGALGDTATSMQSFQQDNPQITYSALASRRILPVVGTWFAQNKIISQQRSYLKQQYKLLESIKGAAGVAEYNLPELTPYQGSDSFEGLQKAGDSVQQAANALLEKLNNALRIRQYLQESGQSLQKLIDSSNFFLTDGSECILENTVDLEALQTNYSKLSGYFEACQQHFHEFNDFYRWRVLLNNCDAISLEILHTLTGSQLPAERWAEWFEFWYYRKVLLRHEESAEEGFHVSDEQLHKLAQLNSTLINLQSQKIGSLWSNQRSNAFRSLSAADINFNSLYNLRGSKRSGGRRNSLRKIIEKDFALFTSLFPIVLTNPSVACTLFASKIQAFDYVVFDEASQLRIEDTFASLLMGKRKIVSGDEHQMPPSSYFWSEGTKVDSGALEDEHEESEFLATSESLLKYIEDLIPDKQHKSYLDYHYRSRHPDLIAFSNSAIYGGNLIPMPAKRDYRAINFKNIRGIYYDSSHGGGLKNTNQDEAVEIVRILREEVKPNSKGKYPSVGIVTFNINQRDLIYDLVNKASTESGEFAEKFHALKEADLFIRSLENVQGDEKDFIIISTTFGKKQDGSFRQNFGHINWSEGYKLLNVLITRAKWRLYVRTSVPEEYYKKIPEATEISGKNLFYSYLYYCSLLAEGNRKQAQQLLEILRQQAPEAPREIQPTNLTESVFEEEVYQELKHLIPETEIKTQFPVGGFRLDFLIGKNIALECDGKTYHKTEEAYKHDMYRQKELEKLGYVFHRIWSTNWFRDKEGELKRFLDFYRSQAASTGT